MASDVKTGQINHRTVCGKQFSVKDGVVKEKAYVYVCPACKRNVASNVKTGQIESNGLWEPVFCERRGCEGERWQTAGLNAKRRSN